MLPFGFPEGSIFVCAYTYFFKYFSLLQYEKETTRFKVLYFSKIP